MNKIVTLKKGNSEELLLIEFQGVFEFDKSEISNIELNIEEVIKDTQYRIIINNTELIGHRVQLKNKIAICKMTENYNSEIKAVIKDKVIFDKRPIPMTEIKKVNMIN